MGDLATNNQTSENDGLQRHRRQQPHATAAQRPSFLAGAITMQSAANPQLMLPPSPQQQHPGRALGGTARHAAATLQNLQKAGPKALYHESQNSSWALPQQSRQALHMMCHHRHLLQRPPDYRALNNLGSSIPLAGKSYQHGPGRISYVPPRSTPGARGFLKYPHEWLMWRMLYSEPELQSQPPTNSRDSTVWPSIGTLRLLAMYRSEHVRN